MARRRRIFPIRGEQDDQYGPRDFKHFGHLQSELKIQIIRKLEPMPYTRFRRTCQTMDQFCEKNRRWLGIQLKKAVSRDYRDLPNIRLFLTNSLNGVPFKGYDDTIPDEPHLVITYYKERRYYSSKYGDSSDSSDSADSSDGSSDSSKSSDPYNSSNEERNEYMPTFCVKMTRENVKKIRKSLSGFAFSSLGLINGWKGIDDSFDKALPYFIQATADLNITHLYIRDFSPAQIAIVDYAKDIRSIELNLNTEKNSRIRKSSLWLVLSSRCENVGKQ